MPYLFPLSHPELSLPGKAAAAAIPLVSPHDNELSAVEYSATEYPAAEYPATEYPAAEYPAAERPASLR